MTMVREEAIRVDEITEEEIALKTKPKLRKTMSVVWTTFLILAVLIAIPVTYVDLVYTAVYIDGQSMAPTLNNFENAAYVEFGIMDERPKTKSKLARGDIIVFDKSSNGTPELLIKRIIALPGESIQLFDYPSGDEVQVLTKTGTTITLDETYLANSSHLATTNATNSGPAFTSPLTLGEDEFFLMGDNRGHSTDSRILGAISFDAIRGKLVAVQGYAEGTKVVGSQTELVKRHFYLIWNWRFY